MNEKSYILFGTGPDAVGLVQQIATPIAELGGNIIDLRQDVLHGLFTVFLVLDFSGSPAGEDEIAALVPVISAETGLDLRLDRFQPVARSPERTNLLLILIGRDRPGIIAAVSDCLRSYRVNIELSEMIARESIFLMELLVDIHDSTLPLANLRSTLRESMAGLGIEALVQGEDCFNKKKRVVVFELAGSLMDGTTRDGILRQAGIPADAFRAVYPAGDVGTCLVAALGRLEGLPLEVLEKLTDAVQPTPGTAELVQTLKTMGYRVTLSAGIPVPLAERLRERLGLDHCYGIETPVDEDAMTFADPSSGDRPDLPARESVVSGLYACEGVEPEDVTVVTDQGFGDGPPPGIHLVFDTRMFLDYLNQHILSRESLIGALGVFGPPVAR